MNKLVFYSFGILVSLILIGCEPLCRLNNTDITNMYSTYVDEWKNDISKSFDDAEKEVFKPMPKPDDLAKPHPDPTKCICKGTGVIVHGDGHKTSCEYHGQKDGHNITRKDIYVR